MLISFVMFALIGDANESNYLPLALGVNVLFNYFPANPTTWYIGTYVHVLLLWFLLTRHVTVKPWMLALCFSLEIPIRAVLIHTRWRLCGLHVGYELGDRVPARSLVRTT